MVTSTRKRKITRSTNRRVKRKIASKHVRQLLKRKVSKRKVMKGGGGHFKIYLVYYTKTKGLFSCPTARLPFNVLGLLFYSEVNNDFFYFGYNYFGIPFYFVSDKQFFTGNQGFDIFTTRTQNDITHILDEELAFIGHLCGLAIDSDQIKNLESGINKNGILRNTTVKYCVNLNRSRYSLFKNNIELGYCSKKTTSSYVSDDAYDNQTETNTKYEITTVGNIEPNTKFEIPSEKEVEIKDKGFSHYFFLKGVSSGLEIERGVSVLDAIGTASIIMNNNIGNNVSLLNYNKNPNNRKIITDLYACLEQMRQAQPSAQQPQQPQEPQPQPQPQTV